MIVSTTVLIQVVPRDTRFHERNHQAARLQDELIEGNQQWSSEPCASGDIEAGLPTLQERTWQVSPHERPKERLELCMWKGDCRGETEHEFNQINVEKWAPRFEGSRHGCRIDLRKVVVGKVRLEQRASEGVGIGQLPPLR